jgi:hypothetical protein
MHYYYLNYSMYVNSNGDRQNVVKIKIQKLYFISERGSQGNDG